MSTEDPLIYDVCETKVTEADNFVRTASTFVPTQGFNFTEQVYDKRANLVLRYALEIVSFH